MEILTSAADQPIVKPFRTHGWIAEIKEKNEEGEYVIVEGNRGGVTRRVALLYTSATDNKHYKRLDEAVDRTFTNGDLYMIDSFAYGLTKKIAPVDQFFPVLVEWNKEIAPASAILHRPKRKPSRVHRIRAENPIASIWARLDQFTSVSLCEKLIRRRAADSEAETPDAVISSKAKGLAFTLRNASDYFNSDQRESLNKRILSLYYGVLALAFAEMLASPQGPADLDEIEGFTKYGHGLYTLGTTQRGFADLGVGVLANGFLPQWANFLGHDVSAYPSAKAKSDDAASKLPTASFCTLERLLSAIPEISDLFSEVFDSESSWILPLGDFEANSHSFVSRPNLDCTYIKLIDYSRKVSLESLASVGWPIAELEQQGETERSRVFRGRVDHPGYKYWSDLFELHHSPFGADSSLLLPQLGGLTEYRAVAFSILYALSILVRYMPQTWRRVEGGDLDQHLALVKTTLLVFERVLPQEFLEAIAGERIIATQTGGFGS